MCDDCKQSVCEYCRKDGVDKCKSCVKIAAQSRVTNSPMKKNKKKRKQPVKETASKKQEEEPAKSAKGPNDASEEASSDDDGRPKKKVSISFYNVPFFFDSIRTCTCLSLFRN